MKKLIVFSTKRLSVILLLISFSFALSSVSHAFLRGDIDNDEKIGLPEAVHALQAVAGLRVVTSGKIINIPGEFSTIQEAIDAASEGDTINVAAGTYTGTLSIVDKRILLQGAGKDNTILSVSGTGTINDPNVVYIKRSLVEITGFQIRNGHQGISAIDSGVACKDSRIEYNFVGFAPAFNSRLEIANAQFKHNTRDGIHISRTSSAYIHDSELMNNGRDGLNVWQGSSAEIRDCTISNNARRGICVANSSSIFLERNSVNLNGERGVGIFHSSSGQLGGGNSISNNTRDGIAIGWDSSLIMGFATAYNQENGVDTISQNGENGILVYFSSSLNAAGGNILNNTQRGIRVFPACSIYLTGCSISNNSLEGVLLHSNSHCMFASPNPTISANEGCGVSYSDGTAWNPNLITFGTGDNANEGGNLCCYDCPE